MSALKNCSFDGSGDAKAFLTKIELTALLKGYTDAKLAAAIACKIDGTALDLYMRLSDDDKLLPSRVKKVLLKEFQRGNRDNEEALAQLSTRSQKTGELLQTYAFKVEGLAKLAYPEFVGNQLKTVIKDNFAVTSIHIYRHAERSCSLLLIQDGGRGVRYGFFAARNLTAQNRNDYTVSDITYYYLIFNLSVW